MLKLELQAVSEMAFGCICLVVQAMPFTDPDIASAVLTRFVASAGVPTDAVMALPSSLTANPLGPITYPGENLYTDAGIGFRDETVDTDFLAGIARLSGTGKDGLETSSTSHLTSALTASSSR